MRQRGSDGAQPVPAGEVAFPVLDGQARTRILDELAIYLADNTQVWILNADGSYTRWQPGTDEPVGARNALLERLATLCHRGRDPGRRLNP